MTTADHRNIQWAEIAFICAVVIGICQRRSGLWTYPTSDEERGKGYAVANGLEERERLRGEFGFASITATWNALEALARLFPQFPRSEIQRAIAEVNSCRGKGGYFGSKIDSFQGERIVGSTRHTALGLLSNLFLSPAGKPDWQAVEETVDWLLKQQVSELAGGWPFDHSTSSESEPMSTASCIAALSCYLALEGNRPDSFRKKEIRQAIQNGFAHLMKSKKRSLWAPRYADTHIIDNVFVFDMLAQAVVRGKLCKIVPHVETELTNTYRELCAAGLGTGWPASWEGPSPSLAATIGVLYLNELRPFIPKALVNRAAVFVAEEVFADASIRQLGAWNWIMFGRLASRHHVLSNEQAQRALELIGKFKTAQELRIPNFKIIELFPPATRPVAVYILTRGEHYLATDTATDHNASSTVDEFKDVPVKSKFKRHVFLSYCREDQREVAQLRDDLIAQGETVWWDQDIRPGQDFMFEIRSAIKAAYAVVMCFSKAAASRLSSGLYPEIRDAIGALREYPPGSTFLIPVRLSECDIPQVEVDSTRTLDRLEYIDLFPPERRSYTVSELVRELRLTPYHP